MVWTDNTMSVSGIADSGQPPVNAVFSAAAPCINLTMTGNRINLTNANQSWLFNVGGTTGEISNNNIHVDSVATGTAASTVSLFGSNLYADSVVQTIGNVWTVDNGGPGLKVAPGSALLAPYSTFTVTRVSGSYYEGPYYGSQTILNLVMSGNVTRVTLGSNRIANYSFALAFVQPATGGPYTIPPTCTNTYWNTGGSGIDCPGAGPKVNPAAGSTTYLWFFDDGTTVHFVSSNYGSGVTCAEGTLGSCAPGGSSITATAGVLPAVSASTLPGKGR